MNNIGAFIAELRKEQSMTQKELADKLGVTDKAVSKWERGKGIPDVYSIERLSSVLGVSVSELFAAKRDETSQNYEIQKNDNITQRDEILRNDNIAQRDESLKNDNIAKKDEIPQYDEAVKNKHKVLNCASNIIFLCVCGALIFTGCYMLLVQRIPLSFQVAGGADGPTAMFVQTKPSMKIAGILLGAGVGLIAVRICFYIKIYKKQNESQSERQNKK